MPRDEQPDVELMGRMIGPRGKSWYFEADFLDEPIYIPQSQCDVVPLPQDGEGRCVVHVRHWLAAKEGWIE